MVRKKNRYLVVKIRYEDDKIDVNLQQEDIKKCIKGMVKELYGDYGLSTFCSGMFVKYNNPYTGVFFLQVARDYHREVRTCVSFVKMLRQRLCVLSCIHVTATLKSAEKYLLDYNTRKMKFVYERCKNPVEKQKLLNIMQELGLIVPSTKS
jgi:RNase P/RNase MRP subunit POP5